MSAAYCWILCVILSVVVCADLQKTGEASMNRLGLILNETQIVGLFFFDAFGNLNGTPKNVYESSVTLN
jgi:hypothetical protein